MKLFQNNVFKIVFLSIGLKLFYAFCALLFSRYFSELYTSCDFNGLIFIFKRNDSWWYEKIAIGWYPMVNSINELGECCNNTPKIQSIWAFFPLYPGIIKVLIYCFNITFDQSAFVVSIFFSTAAFIGFYKFVCVFFKDESVALFSTFMLILFPFHLFFSMFYTEALFLTFTIWAFIFVHKGKIYLLPILLIPLTLVRPNGLFVIIPLFLYYLEKKGVIEKIQIHTARISKQVLFESCFFLSAPIVFFIYCWYQYKFTGYWNAFSIAQIGWCRHFHFPLLSLFTSSHPSLIFNSVYTVFAMSFSLFLWRKIPLSLSLFIWINLLIPLTSSVMSMPRFISIIFPFWMMFGYFVYRFKYRWLLYFCLILAHGFMFFFWMKSSFFCI